MDAMNNDALIRPFEGSDLAFAPGAAPDLPDQPAPDTAVADTSDGGPARIAGSGPAANPGMPEPPAAGNDPWPPAGRQRWSDGADPTDPPHPDGLARRVQQARERQGKLEKALEDQKAKVDRCFRDWRHREDARRRRGHERLGAFMAGLAPDQAVRAVTLIAEGKTLEEVMTAIPSGMPS